MALIDLGLLTSNTQRTDRVSTLESNDVFQFSLEGSQDVVFSLGADLGWTVRDQSGAIVAEPDAGYDGGDVALTNLGSGILYSLEVRRTDQDLDYTLTIAPGDSPLIDPLTGEDPADSADGVFIVGANGQLEFDYALDDGRYQGEAGIVSLHGLADFEWGAADWTREIVDRVLSNSSLGYHLVSDRVDNPWIDLFHDETGEYRGSQIVEMTPGDAVAIVLIPNGTFAEVRANPEIGGDKRPLFSIATANPDDGFYFGQIAVADRDIYVMEDKRIDLGSDRDYNDFGFRLTGVTPRGIGSIDDLIQIAPGKDDWRTTIPRWDNVAPIVEFDVTGLDLREFPISGTVTDENGAWDIDSLTAEVTDASGNVVRTIAINLTPSGNGHTFSIDRTVATGGLGAGTYSLTLTPRDLKDTGSAIVAIDLVISPSNSTTDPGLTPAQNPDPDPTNTAPNSPLLDTFSNAYNRGTTLTLSGQVTDADGWADIDRVMVELIDPAGQPVNTTTIETLTQSDDDTARFAVDVALAATLAAGSYGLRVTAIDAAGATSTIASQSLTVTIPHSNVDDPDPRDPDPQDPAPQRPNLLKFGALPLYTTDETLRFSNARAADPDGWRNIALIDFAWVAPDGTVIDIVDDVTEFRDGGDGTARFDFEVEFAGLAPGKYQLRGRAIDYDADGSVSGAYAQWSQSVWVVSGDGDTDLSNSVRWGLVDHAQWADDPERMVEPATGWVIWLTPGTDIAATAVAIGATAFSSTAINHTWGFEFDGSRTNGEIRDQLAAIDGVELAYPDGKQQLRYHAPGQATDTLFDEQWSLQTGATEIWSDRTISDIWQDFDVLGNSIRIAFVDGGLDTSDAEFVNRDVQELDLTGDPNGEVAQKNVYESPFSPINDDYQLIPRVRAHFPEDDRLSYKIDVLALGSLTDLSFELKLAELTPEDLTQEEQALLQSLDVETLENLIDKLNVKLHVPAADGQILDLKDAARNTFWSWRPGWGDGEVNVPPHVYIPKLENLESDGLIYTFDKQSSQYENRVSKVKHQFVGGQWTISFDGPKRIMTTPGVEELVERAIESVRLRFDYVDTHGTSVMSIAVAGIGNGSGDEDSMLGVAPQADIFAIQLIGELDPLTQTFGQAGRTIQKALYDSGRDLSLPIVNNSWGTEAFAFLPLASAGLKAGFETGADGLGTVYVWSAGNDRLSLPGIGHIGQYPLNSSRFGVSVGAAAFAHDDWVVTDYSNSGTFIVAPSSAHIGNALDDEFDSRLMVLSGDQYGERYTDTFSGTSAAAPFVSGVVALLREYNPALTARDIQHILAETAKPIDLGYDADSTQTRSFPYFDDNGNRQTAKVPENWFDVNHDAAALGVASGRSQNYAGKAFSYRHGFGLIDAYAAIELADPATYELLPQQVSAKSVWQYVAETIPDGGSIVVSDDNSARQMIDEDIDLEWVEVSLTTDHQDWGELTVVLESPSETSVILKRAMADAIPLADGSSLAVESPVLNPGQGWVTDESKLSSSPRNWTFSTPFFRGESALGDWTLRVYDEHDNDVSGELIGWQVEVFGTQPGVSVSVLDGSASEAGDGAMIAIERSGDLSESLQVSLNWTNADDAMTRAGEALPDSVQFAAGQETVLIPIVAKHDYLVEGEESLGLTLVNSSGHHVTGGTAVIAIADSTTTSRYEDFLYEYDGHFYLLSEADTWHGAQAQAEALGGNLVAINSAEEEAWIRETFDPFSLGAIWMGATDSELYGFSEGEFGWVNGEELTYQNWPENEPNDYGDGEDFAHIRYWSEGHWKFPNGAWNDTPASLFEYRGVIEIDPSQLETPIVNVMVTDAEADEAGNAGQILIQRVGDLSQPLTVNLSQNGTATNGVDYREIPDTVTIAAGESLAIVPVIGIFDGESEAEEVVTVSIGKSADYRSGAYGTGQVTIGDRDSDFTPTIITNPDTGKRYFATPTDTWLGAEETAKHYGGHLVTVENAAENQWLIDTFGSGSHWIGYTDSPVVGAVEGKFQWVDGKTSTYTAWFDGYPDNNRRVSGLDEGEDFAHMYAVRESHGWNDRSADYLMPGLVELDDTAPSIVVEPIQEWARQAGSAGFEVGESVAVDNAGNVFLAGWITGDIDGHTYQGRDATVGSTGDTYLARYDRDGNQLWQRSIGTDGDDAFYGVTTDAEGNAYAVGATNRAIGGATNFGSSDGIIVKYDTSGDIAWTKQIGTSEFDRFWDVQADGAGNFYAIGSTVGLLDGVQTHAGYDALIVQFDPDGNIGWTRQLTSTANSNTEGLHAAIDPTTNDILITGQVGGTLDGETSGGNRDIFVARYSPAGDLLWNTQFGSSEEDVAQAIDIANDGMIYIAGKTYGVLPGETAGENRDVVVAKLGKDGSLIWTDQFSVEGVGGERDSDDYAYGLVVDGNQILVSGHVGGSLDGNPAAGQIDAFLATYDTQGRRGESLQFGFPSWDSLKELVTDGAGTTYGVGSISGALPGETQAGSIDLMLAKFSRSQEYVPGEPLALTEIGVNDDGELVTATLTLSDVAAGTLATTVANVARVEFSDGRLTVEGSPDEVNAVLAGVEFTAVLGYDGNVTIATGVSDGFNEAIGETISLSMDDRGLRLDPVDYAALRALYESTDGENWTNNMGWSDWDFSREVPPLVSIVEDWYGIDTEGNTVNILQMSGNGLTGGIPAELGNLSNLSRLVLHNQGLTGGIPAELGNLSNLKHLSLFSNDLSGDNLLRGEIPIELGNLSSLEYLALHGIGLTGGIPAELGNLSNLSQLYLSNNQLTGEIPAELGALSNLSQLYLSNNQLTGEIPTELGALSNLSQLSLPNNQLTGEIPTELSFLSSLEILYLSNNQLTGEIPTELGFLSSIEILELYNNDLSGEIPVELGNLSRLSRLFLQNNHLRGEIPIEFLELDSLEWLQLQNNNLYGEIPAGLINLPTIEMPNLVIVDLSGNNFGSEPRLHWSDYAALKTLYQNTEGVNWTNNTGWSSWDFSSELPPLASIVEDWHGINLEGNNVNEISLSVNGLSGEIPAELGNLSELSFLSLGGNRLSGEIPAELGNLSNLSFLNLNVSGVSGEIPAELGNLSNLTWLFLADNSLSGEIPTELGNLSNLLQLELSRNVLSGEIPAELGNLSKLLSLTLGNNSLSGSIPEQLFNLGNLTVLELQNNNLSGIIPTGLINPPTVEMPKLVNIDLSGNSFT